MQAGFEYIDSTERSSAARPAAAGERGSAQWALKRGLDIVLAAAFLLGLLPTMLIAILLILVVDRQSPLYLDERVGRGGKTFRCMKLRTLRSDPRILESYLAAHPDEAERYRLTRKLRHDPRKTRIGAFLREHSIDEAPQFINVLLGQMSIVGPRPITASELSLRGAAAADLTLVKPGLTGLWQVNGRSALAPEARAGFDSYYAHHWSVRLDLSIIIRTPLIMLTGRGAL
jgi:exopolysaccharide production protein ExoY